MVKQLSFVEARNNLSLLVDEVSENKTRVIIQKRGKDKVVIISAYEYLRSIIPVDPLLAELRQQATLKSAHTISDAEIDAEIKAVRTCILPRRGSLLVCR